MARVLITPVNRSVRPFEVEGVLTWKYYPKEGKIYYINGSSYPDNTVKILDRESEAQ